MSNLWVLTLFEVIIYHCFILGAEHVSVYWGAEPADSEGFPICHEDGKPDERPEDQVQTDWGWEEIHHSQKLPGILQPGLITVWFNQMFNRSFLFGFSYISFHEFHLHHKHVFKCDWTLYIYTYFIHYLHFYNFISKKRGTERLEKTGEWLT